ncbi:hypothetical protein QVD17_37812 [Tagetes erecta]|uniref:Uncharacterized protein n=1 Tax=Tagetes erecta TaxID=13708 RepID=A0AAD8K183_TARER|nr:hypothetical protein QVD17_37812 [Tagetes erecta]
MCELLVAIFSATKMPSPAAPKGQNPLTTKPSPTQMQKHTFWKTSLTATSLLNKAADNKASFFVSHSLQRHLLLYL